MNELTVWVELTEFPQPCMGWVLVRSDEFARLEVLATGHHQGMTVETLAKELQHIHEAHGCNRFVFDAPRGWVDSVRYWMRGNWPSVKLQEAR